MLGFAELSEANTKYEVGIKSSKPAPARHWSFDLEWKTVDNWDKTCACVRVHACMCVTSQSKQYNYCGRFSASCQRCARCKHSYGFGAHSPFILCAGEMCARNPSLTFNCSLIKMPDRMNKTKMYSDVCEYAWLRMCVSKRGWYRHTKTSLGLGGVLSRQCDDRTQTLCLMFPPPPSAFNSRSAHTHITCSAFCEFVGVCLIQYDT